MLLTLHWNTKDTPVYSMPELLVKSLQPVVQITMQSIKTEYGQNACDNVRALNVTNLCTKIRIRKIRRDVVVLDSGSYVLERSNLQCQSNISVESSSLEHNYKNL